VNAAIQWGKRAGSAPTVIARPHKAMAIPPLPMPSSGEIATRYARNDHSGRANSKFVKSKHGRRALGDMFLVLYHYLPEK